MLQDMVVGDAAEGIVLVHVAGSDTKVRLSAPYGTYYYHAE